MQGDLGTLPIVHCPQRVNQEGTLCLSPPGRGR